MRLLDTDTCVEILRGNERVIERRATVADSVATTWITASELYFGAAKSHRPKNNHALVTRFLATLPILSLDRSAAEIFGNVKVRLQREGRRLTDADLFIGAIAVAQDATVVTGNRRHYDRIPGWKWEDWIRD